MTLAAALSITLFGVACGGEAEPAGPMSGADAGDVSDPCQRGTLEDDFASIDGSPAVLVGRGVDPATGALSAPAAGTSYIVSSTYLRLRGEPAAQERFGELMGPIIPTLMENPGLVAMSLGTSGTCGTARTLTVWESEEAMMAFVASPAHLAAIGSVAEVSRGGSVVTHWVGTDASWEDAATRLSTFEGPTY